MKFFCKFLLWITGWKTVEPPVEEPKCIILGVPHTSVWDFVISYAYYKSVGGNANVMIKKEFFWGPLGPLLRSLGGVPVDRKHGGTVVRQMIEAFNNSKNMHLAIAPEGTRKPTLKWKTGFHTIAKACNVPVYLGYFDWGTKRIGRGEKFELSDNAQEDLKKIMEIYKKMNLKGRHREGYSL
jgi:1-acyl-sn-glycerol-3-phosphate acyltransferase